MALAYHWQNDACMFAAITGVIWGLWHAPAIVMGHNYGMGYAGFPIAGILIMTLACTAMTCWFACFGRGRAAYGPVRSRA